MVVKFKDLESWSSETLLNAQRWERNGVNLGKVLGANKKYFIIDWDGVEADDVSLDEIDREVIMDYICDGKAVNNKAVLYKMQRFIEFPNEEILWNTLVNERVISNELYLNNNYGENFDIWWKMINHYIK